MQVKRHIQAPMSVALSWPKRLSKKATKIKKCSLLINNTKLICRAYMYRLADAYPRWPSLPQYKMRSRSLINYSSVFALLSRPSLRPILLIDVSSHLCGLCHFTGAELRTFLARWPPGGAIAAAALSLGGGQRKTGVVRQTSTTSQHQIAVAFTDICTHTDARQRVRCIHQSTFQ